MRVYIVQQGDTLWKIAKQHNLNFEQLKQMNHHLANPDLLMPGMEIFLPEEDFSGGNVLGKQAKKTSPKPMPTPAPVPLPNIPQQQEPIQQMPPMPQMPMPQMPMPQMPMPQMPMPQPPMMEPIVPCFVCQMMPWPTPMPWSPMPPMHQMPAMEPMPQMPMPCQPMPQMHPMPMPCQPMPQMPMHQMPMPPMQNPCQPMPHVQSLPPMQPGEVQPWTESSQPWPEAGCGGDPAIDQQYYEQIRALEQQASPMPPHHPTPYW